MKMLNEFKVKVNREESKKLQEVLFENGYGWNGHKEIEYLDCNYIYSCNQRLFLLDDEHYFNKCQYKELAVEFILGFYSSNIEPHTSTIWKQIENPNLATDKEIEQVINEEYEKDNSINNGGKTDYYQLENAPFKINDFDDFAEWRGLNGNQFNMGKVMWTFNVGRHSATDYERELNKVIHYANREKLRISRELKNEN